MNCENVERKIFDYLDGDLTEEETKELMTHLESCQACSNLLDRYQKQDRLLTRYYDTVSQVATGVPKPEIEAPRQSSPRRRLAYPLYAAAAIICFIALSGLFLVIHKQVTEGASGPKIGKVIRVMGQVQYLEDDKLKSLDQGMAIHANTRLKTTVDSYLAVSLGKTPGEKEPNLVEFKANSFAKFKLTGDRLELGLERGEVWVHLNHETEKSFAVRGRGLLAINRGTIFNVAQGMTGSSVGVVTGEVEVQQKTSKHVVKPREFYTTFENKSGDNVRNHVYWSQYSDKLLALLGMEEKKTRVAETKKPLQVREVEKKEVQLPAQPEGEELGTLETTELLPMDTRFFFEVYSVPATIGEWKASDYSSMFRDPALLSWWKSKQMEDLRNEITKAGIPRWIELAESIPGSLSLGVSSSGHPIIVADCREDAEEVRELIETRFRPHFVKWFGSFQMPDRSIPEIHLKRGYLVLGWGKTQVNKVLKAIEEDTPTGFKRTRFYENIRLNVPSSRMTVAFDFYSTMASLKEKKDPDIDKFLARSGFENLDYVLGSPDFSGRGINQAFRVAFTGPRKGVAGWLDNPSPMGSLYYWAPDVHFVVAARIKNPREMFTDVIGWLIEDCGNMSLREETSFALLGEIAACFGNEVSFGLQNPVMPIPNIRMVMEIIKPMEFHDQMIDFVERLEACGVPDIIMDSREYRDKLIVTISTKDLPFDISYAVLDDYLIIGLGEPFLRYAVDSFLEGRSLMEEHAFTSMLPDMGQLNFSLLCYQNLAQSIPNILEKYSSVMLPKRGREILPESKVLKRFQSAGISYAVAMDECIDFYINGSKGVDFNIGGALPIVASLITPRLYEGGFNDKVGTAQKRLRSIATAVEAYFVDHNRYPETLDELLSPIHYLESIPRDPFSEDQSQPLSYILDSTGESYIIYSVGPNGEDDVGAIPYDHSKGNMSPGDIIRRGPN